jgi:MFS family permease
VPSFLSLLIANFAAGRARSRALAAYGAMAGLGFVVGMVGGGLITELLGWRWIFLLNIPIVMIMLLPVREVLPESRNTSLTDSIDVGGAITVTLGLILLIFSMTSAPRHGWLAPETWGAGLLGLAAMILFVVIERHHADPLVPPAIVAKTGWHRCNRSHIRLPDLPGPRDSCLPGGGNRIRGPARTARACPRSRYREKGHTETA